MQPYPIYQIGRPAGTPFAYPSYFHPAPIQPLYPARPLPPPPPPYPFAPFIGTGAMYIPSRGGPVYL